MFKEQQVREEYHDLRPERKGGQIPQSFEGHSKKFELAAIERFSAEGDTM